MKFIKLFEDFNNDLLYHGSNKLFDSFTRKYINGIGLKYGYGLYFSSKKETAEIFSSKQSVDRYLYTVKLRSKNLLKWTDLTTEQLILIEPLLNDLNINIDKYDTTFSHIYFKIKNKLLKTMFPDDMYDDNVSKYLSNLLEKIGFDGIYDKDEYCIFNPNNIQIVDIEKIV